MLRRLLIAIVYCGCNSSAAPVDASRDGSHASDATTDVACPGVGHQTIGASCRFNSDCCSGVCHISGAGPNGSCIAGPPDQGSCLPGGSTSNDIVACCSGDAFDQVCTGDPDDYLTASCVGAFYVCETSFDCCSHCCNTNHACDDPTEQSCI